MRTSVDLPEPDRPMTTNTSPGDLEAHVADGRDASGLRRSSARGRSASGVPTILSALGPKTFQTSSTVISGSRVRSTRSATLGTTAPLHGRRGRPPIGHCVAPQALRARARLSITWPSCRLPYPCRRRLAGAHAHRRRRTHTVRCRWNRRQAPDSPRSSRLRSGRSCPSPSRRSAGRRREWQGSAADS